MFVSGALSVLSTAAPRSIPIRSRRKFRARQYLVSRPHSMARLRLRTGRVEQTNFDSYQMLRIDEAPAIEVHIVQSSEPPGGMGEAGTSAIVPAVTNAIFAAAGKRLRKLPVDPSALKKSA